MSDWQHFADRAGVEFFDYQDEAFDKAADMDPRTPRRCLYYKTGAGKSITALVQLLIWGQSKAIVVTPPATFGQWVEWGRELGVSVSCMSHAKFRMKQTRLPRDWPVIADEMHLFGGHDGQGWQKLNTLAMHLQAPLVMASATPNYNDADRVYCIQHILDPHGTKGGFLEFIYKHCTTEQNPFGMMPVVTGFQRFDTAAEYLAALSGVDYLEDDLVYQIEDVEFWVSMAQSFETYGFWYEKDRIIASQMEERHARTYMARVCEDGFIHNSVLKLLLPLIEESPTPVLVFCQHATIAEALARSLEENGTIAYDIVTGTASKKQKEISLGLFKAGRYQVLIGTATLATGTDGLDKVCDRMVILDDTDDDALRRQLVGRIMPRGSDTDVSKKQVYRLVQQ